MTVNVQSGVSPVAIGNGTNPVFPFGFQITDVDAIAVYADGELVDPTDYAVYLAPDWTGDVTFAVPPASGVEILLASYPTFSQQSVHLRAGPFFPDVVEDDLDRAAIRDIYLKSQTDRALKVPPGETPPSLPPLDGGSSGVLYYSDGEFDLVPLPAKGDPGGDASQVGTRLQAETMNFAAGINMVRTTGFAERGDGGAATYVRWAATMAALIANQEGYSWFESADGAQWTLIDVEVRPEMFGAMGHATNDEGLPIRRMFEFASGRTVLLTKTHRYKSQTAGVDDIRIYSNTRVRGISALTCGFKRIPNTLGEAMATPAYGVWCQDADEVYISDIFHDVQRSGLGQPSAAKQRVNGLLVRGRNGRVRVERMIVLNATGYAFYQGAVGANYSTDVVMTDCTAINSQVSFELTGKDSAWRLERPRSLQYVTDGGAVVPGECGYHQYGGVGGAYHENPYHRGSAVAVLSVLTDAFENREVVYENSDFEVSIPGIACAIVRNDAFGTNGKRSQAKFIGGRIVNTNGPASDFTAALVDVNDAQFIGRTAALGVGPNSIVALSGDFDLQCTEPVTTPSGSAALAAVIDAAATVTRTPSGSITATHLNGGAEVAVAGNITLADDTFIDPPIGGGGVLGTEAPRHIQRLRGYKVEGPSGLTNFINAGGNVYWASMVLSSIPTGWTTSSQDTDFNKVIVSASLELAGQSGVVSTVPHGIHWYRRPGVAQGEVFFVINTTAALPANTRLRYDIVEEA